MNDDKTPTVDHVLQYLKDSCALMQLCELFDWYIDGYAGYVAFLTLQTFLEGQ